MPASVVSLTCTPKECALVYDGGMGELDKRVRNEIPCGYETVSVCSSALKHPVFHTVLQFKVLVLIVFYHRLI